MMRSIKEDVYINVVLRDTTTRVFDLGVIYQVILFVGKSKLQDHVKPAVLELPSGKIQSGYHKHLAMELISSKHLTESKYHELGMLTTSASFMSEYDVNELHSVINENQSFVIFSGVQFHLSYVNSLRG